MPIYLYEREDGSTFEKLQKMSDEYLTVCPETGQAVKRLMSPPALHFKGTGFYKTDYTSNGASPAPSEGSSESKSESSSASGESSSKSGESSKKETSSSSSSSGSESATSSAAKKD